MADKGLNLFVECSARCLHLSPQEEERNSSSGGDNKMYTSDNIVNSQRTLAEIGDIGKVRILVEQVML